MIRTVRALVCLLAAGVGLSGCSDPDAPSVVLYTSTDDAFARAVVEAFETETGVRVELVGDTEATKTTGLVTRLQAEAGSPRCDVWWSSEPLGTILLAESGVLEPGGMEGTVPADWPDELVGDGWDWVGFAERGRVFVYATDRVEEPPTTLAELTGPAWRGRVGMARPQFGTTRGHMALLHARWGEARFSDWLGAMRENGVRLYDGNARVVRAVYEGEIDAGLTDTDDVWVAIANGWPVGMTWDAAPDGADGRWPSPGPTTIPNTVGIIRGGPNPEHARTLAAFLVSERVERLLAASDSRNIPVHADARAAFSELRPPEGGDRPDYRDAHAAVPAAMDACRRVLISP